MRNVVIMLLVGFVASVCANGAEKTTYQTALGPLIEGSTLGKGTVISSSGEFKSGCIEVGKGQAFEVGNVFDVLRQKSSESEPALTLVQDKATGHWLATDGIVGIDQGVIGGLFEGHTVHIVGGSENPIVIGGKTFSDTNVVIRNGLVVAGAAASRWHNSRLPHYVLWSIVGIAIVLMLIQGARIAPKAPRRTRSLVQPQPPPAFVFACPYCDVEIQLPANTRGTKACECPQCQKTFDVELE
jgi:hypothetical protein